jgi:fumarate hydratase subunit alpha
MKRADVIGATVRVLKQAETSLPEWVLDLIERAEENETNPVARSHLRFMLENVRIAGTECLPLCQDTGLLVFRAELGRDAGLDFDLREAIADGVRLATKKIPLRPNVVDPLTRQTAVTTQDREYLM